MKKNKISLYFILISFLTFITIFFSIIQKSYFSLIKPQKLVENNILLKEFNPNLDLNILSIIESKNKNTDEHFDFSTIGIDKSLIITPTIQPTVISTVSSEILNETTPSL
jgi:anionic cell wall polymer biosynthesis LytR-Cps2A-Psr (LCP) family protein